nr:putative helicase magatama 3 [Ipomoea batatas]
MRGESSDTVLDSTNLRSTLDDWAFSPATTIYEARAAAASFDAFSSSGESPSAASIGETGEMERVSSAKRKAWPKDDFTDMVFSLTLEDIFNENMFKDQVSLLLLNDMMQSAVDGGGYGCKVQFKDQVWKRFSQFEQTYGDDLASMLKWRLAVGAAEACGGVCSRRRGGAVR